MRKKGQWRSFLTLLWFSSPAQTWLQAFLSLTPHLNPLLHVLFESCNSVFPLPLLSHPPTSFFPILAINGTITTTVMSPHLSPLSSTIVASHNFPSAPAPEEVPVIRVPIAFDKEQDTFVATVESDPVVYRTG